MLPLIVLDALVIEIKTLLSVLVQVDTLMTLPIWIQNAFLVLFSVPLAMLHPQHAYRAEVIELDKIVHAQQELMKMERAIIVLFVMLHVQLARY